MNALVPPYQDLLWPTLQAVIAIGGSGRISEINQAVVERGRYSEAQQSVLHGDGPQTEIEYRHVAAGRAISFLPASVADAYMQSGIAYVPVTDIPPIQICLAWKLGQRTALVSALAEAITDTR
jgi:DNA-binding transcriptional LysR family regulator